MSKNCLEEKIAIMNEQHTKSFRAAYEYWFEDKPINEAIEGLNEKKKSEEKETKKEEKKEEHEKGESKEKEEKEEHEASETAEEEKVEEKAKKEDKKEKKEKKGKKDLKEEAAFETHVLCNSCGSGDLELSKKKTKIRCKKCGNTGLTEGIVGLKV